MRQIDALGWSLDGEQCLVRPTVRRKWKLWISLSVALHRNSLSSKQLEVLVGHCTFLSLIRRQGLSALHAVYAYIQKGVSKAS